MWNARQFWTVGADARECRQEKRGERERGYGVGLGGTPAGGGLGKQLGQLQRKALSTDQEEGGSGSGSGSPVPAWGIYPLVFGLWGSAGIPGQGPLGSKRPLGAWRSNLSTGMKVFS